MPQQPPELRPREPHETQDARKQRAIRMHLNELDRKVNDIYASVGLVVLLIAVAVVAAVGGLALNLLFSALGVS